MPPWARLLGPPQSWGCQLQGQRGRPSGSARGALATPAWLPGEGPEALPLSPPRPGTDSLSRQLPPPGGVKARWTRLAAVGRPAPASWHFGGEGGLPFGCLGGAQLGPGSADHLAHPLRPPPRLSLAWVPGERFHSSTRCLPPALSPPWLGPSALPRSRAAQRPGPASAPHRGCWQGTRDPPATARHGAVPRPPQDDAPSLAGQGLSRLGGWELLRVGFGPRGRAGSGLGGRPAPAGRPGSGLGRRRAGGGSVLEPCPLEASGTLVGRAFSSPLSEPRGSVPRARRASRPCAPPQRLPLATPLVQHPPPSPRYPRDHTGPTPWRGQHGPSLSRACPQPGPGPGHPNPPQAPGMGMSRWWGGCDCPGGWARLCQAPPPRFADVGGLPAAPPPALGHPTPAASAGGTMLPPCAQGSAWQGRRQP